ncbi:hypothetical protein [Magnetospirillum fulvum]|uniref:hypothetical protein n=1 Tax=Magnetospirillum fulvum TaxID=1082 RepID=UPI0012DE866B|nr:hypothetical protein [Magnetospirillum fulvum]
MPTIIGIPLHIIVIGMPIAIIVVMRSHIAFIMSMVMPAVGIILQTMPSAVISQVIVQHGVGIIIGIIMPLFIIGMVMPFIIGIVMPFIMGMVIPFIIGIIMPFIIGICIGIVAVGICIAVIMVVPLLPCGGPSVRPFSSIKMLRCRGALNRSWRRDVGFLRCRVGM